MFLCFYVYFNQMPRIITISNTKGGTGKSTLTFNIHNYLAAQGAKVAICDLDHQKSITDLSQDKIKLLELEEIAAAGEQFVLIDTPPYRATEVKQVLDITDFLLIPILPSILDFKAAQAIIQDAQEAGVNFSLVMNRVKAKSSFPPQIRAELESQGIPVLSNEIGDRVEYARSMLLHSLEADKKAAKEIADLTTEILTKLI